jgi:hypothetical protein
LSDGEWRCTVSHLPGPPGRGRPVYIFIAALIAVFARKTCEFGKEGLAKRRDRVWLRVLGISFVLANGLMIGMAAITG